MLAELTWGASKSLLSGIAILAVIWALGLQQSWMLSLWVMPVVLLIGLAFSAMGLVMTAVSPSYDFFMYYFTLVITPMVLLCGVFYPVERMPEILQNVAAVLPLSHAIDLVRPLILGHVPAAIFTHVAALLAWTTVSYWLAVGLTRRRILK
jgi:lipooligosaccharide transport system permease protein